jgi:hypothetical protein
MNTQVHVARLSGWGSFPHGPKNKPQAIVAPATEQGYIFWHAIREKLEICLHDKAREGYFPASQFLKDICGLLLADRTVVEEYQKRSYLWQTPMKIETYLFTEISN